MKFDFQIREAAKIPNKQFADHLEILDPAPDWDWTSQILFKGPVQSQSGAGSKNFFKNPASKQLLPFVQRTDLTWSQRALRFLKFKDGRFFPERFK